MILKDQLNILFQSQKINQKQFADILEIAQSTLNNYLSGESEPNFKNIMRFLEVYPELNANWLLKGEGEMFVSKNGIIENKNPNIEQLNEDQAEYKKVEKKPVRTEITEQEIVQKQVELLMIEMKRLNLKVELLEGEVAKLKKEKK